ncbi:Aste57867_159 [Aphanomyces stellatus]|uniref:Aste57867_159 protein n=1 Tax=Aphanomyces stellatus TaxID=120398 RepID=A0A485K1W5_9STRA|nr:hypothetical protein As57867_000159 [Aphanomyces stellatus]VFT77385.1 Aste57867_159 [Aphanomyces stellatus]
MSSDHWSDNDEWEDAQEPNALSKSEEEKWEYSEDDESKVWEDAISPRVHEASDDDEPSHLIPKNAEDWDALNAALNEQVVEDNTPMKREKMKRLTKAEKGQWHMQRQAHLVCLLAREGRIHSAINDSTLQGLLRSISPIELEQVFKSKRSQGVVFLVQNLVQWFRLEFRRVPYVSARSAQFDVTLGSLLDAFFSREGREHEMVCLFTALCRAWNLSTRYTCVLDTPTVVKRHAPFEPFFGIDHGGEMNNSENDRRSNASLRAWCEVFASNGWVHVDVIRNMVNQPQEVERLRGRGCVMPHIVSFESSGRIVDVSRQYSSQWARTQLVRENEVWWSQLLQVGKSSDAPVDVDEKLPIPTSVNGFKSHSQYCLEQHLGLYEWIYPRKPVGVFKGLPVFERQSVHTLHAAHRWLRQGRVVLESERATPCKSVPKSQRSQKTSAPPFLTTTPFSVATSVVSTEETLVPLYGRWQTEIYVAPLVVDGIIPKNEHGNIEILCEASLPVGTIHLRLPRAKKVAQQLGVDFAPALVDWESRNGRNVPVFDGIVVCEHVVEMVEDAHAALEHSLVEKSIAQRKKEIAKRWAVFVKKLLLRKRLRDEYG